jgi:hypothetical protein
MKRLLLYPSIFHGIMMGLVLFAIKLTLFLGGKWMFRLDSGYALASFIAILLAMYFGSRGERIRHSFYSYWQAVVSCIKVAAIAVSISLAADMLIYRVLDKTLAAKATAFNVSMLKENLSKVHFFSNAVKTELIKKTEATNPMDSFSWSGYLAGVFSFTVLNSFWALLVGLFTRRRISMSNEDRS